MPLLFGMDVAYLIVISWKTSNNVHRGIYQTIQASRDSSLCACSMLQDFYHLFFICKNKFHVLDFYGYFTMDKRVWPHLLLWVESDTFLFTKLKKTCIFLMIRRIFKKVEDQVFDLKLNYLTVEYPWAVHVLCIFTFICN